MSTVAIARLDWDDISLNEAKARIQYIEHPDTDIGIKGFRSLSLLRAYISPSGKGYHCELYFDAPVDIMEVRKRLWDDRVRLSLDNRRSNSRSGNILHSYKINEDGKRERLHIRTHNIYKKNYKKVEA